MIGIALLGSVAASGGGLAIALAIGAAAFALGLAILVGFSPRGIGPRVTTALPAFAPAQHQEL